MGAVREEFGRNTFHPPMNREVWIRGTKVFGKLDKLRRVIDPVVHGRREEWMSESPVDQENIRFEGRIVRANFCGGSLMAPQL